MEGFTGGHKRLGQALIEPSGHSLLSWNTVHKNQKKRRVEKDDQKTTTRNTKTARPSTVDEKCPFSFTVFWQDPPNDNPIISSTTDSLPAEATQAAWGWYIGLCRKGNCGAGNCNHEGHMQLKAAEVKKATTSIGEDKLQLTVAMANARTPSAAIQSFLQSQTGNLLNSKQILYTSKLNVNPRMSSECGGNASPADRLLLYLSGEPTVSYILLFDDPSSSLLSIKKQRKRRVKYVLRKSTGE
jgi:hypothetical protein